MVVFEDNREEIDSQGEAYLRITFCGVELAIARREVKCTNPKGA